MDSEKVFDKIQHAFKIEVLEKVGLEGPYLNQIKTTYENSRAMEKNLKRSY